MAFSMLKSQTNPIAIDFGTATVKLLQTATGEDRPLIVAATELAIPDAVRGDDQQRYQFLAEFLPGALAQMKFKGKRAVISIPSARTSIQHMQITPTDGVSTDDLVKAELNARTGISPDSIVARHLDVGPASGDGQSRQEVVCLAMSRESVMQYIDLLQKQKIAVAGVHTEPQAVAHAFSHLYRREGDEQVTTIYVDFGWGGTRIVIAHGPKIVFARNIQIGGQNFDQVTKRALRCDLATARTHRISLADQTVRKPRVAVVAGQTILATAADTHHADQTVVVPERRTPLQPPDFVTRINGETVDLRFDFTELLDILADEVDACERYYRSFFPDRPLERAVFIGGEARHTWMVGPIVEHLDLTTHLGDPLSRFDLLESTTVSGFTLDDPQPGWAVVCGLCNAPTEL